MGDTSDSITLGHQPRELCPLQETTAEKTKSKEITTQQKNLRQRSSVVYVNLIHCFLHLRTVNSWQIGPVSEGPTRWSTVNCCFAHFSCHCTVYVRNHPPLQPPPPCPINPCSGPASKQIKCTLSGPRPWQKVKAKTRCKQGFVYALPLKDTKVPLREFFTDCFPGGREGGPYA